jgi:hypothetical protein
LSLIHPSPSGPSPNRQKDPHTMSKWVDPENPALSPVQGVSSSDIVWARPEQLGDSPSLFVDGAEEGEFPVFPHVFE